MLGDLKRSSMTCQKEHWRALHTMAVLPAFSPVRRSWMRAGASHIHRGSGTPCCLRYSSSAPGAIGFSLLSIGLKMINEQGGEHGTWDVLRKCCERDRFGGMITCRQISRSLLLPLQIALIHRPNLHWGLRGRGGVGMG